MTDYYAYDHGLLCKNPNCKSHGQSHPNCRCYGKATETNPRSGQRNQVGLHEYAKGGSVCEVGLPHEKECVYYAEGGGVQPPLVAPQPLDAVPNTLGMVGVNQGLLGLLRGVGHSKLADPEKQIQKIYDLRNEPDLDRRTESMHQHPLAAGTPKAHLKSILHRLAAPLATQEPHPVAMKSGVDYLHSSIRGEGELKTQAERLLGSHRGNERTEPDEEKTKQLKEHLKSLEENPNALLNVGGELGHYLPDHSTGLAYQAAVATHYFKGLKPKPQQLAPLDTLEATDKMAEANYDRQLEIAQKPTLVLQHVTDGTLVPQDLTTLHTLYPGLYQSILNRASEALIQAKSKNLEIPYKQKQTLSLLLGQPLDFTQSPMAAQAILGSSIPKTAPSPQGKPSAKKSGATAAELKQINKVDELYETPLEARQINKNAR